MHVVNSTLAAWGQLAAIIICLYAVIFVLLAVVFNLAAAIGLAWVSEKIRIIKMLRPTVTSLNETAKLLEAGGTPSTANTNKVITTIADVPARVHTLEKQVDNGTNKVADVAIEFNARRQQVQTILKGLFLPNAAQRALPSPTSTRVDQQGLEFNSPGYRILMEKKAPEVPVSADDASNGIVQTASVTSTQLKDAPAH